MLAILTTHPIQYQVPLWQALAKDGRVPFEVWYLTKHGLEISHDREFGKAFAWDLDLLSGYSHRFLEVAEGASPSSFWKCSLRKSLRTRLRDSGAKVLWIQGWQVAAYWQAVREAKAAGVDVWLRGESNDLAPVAPWKQLLKRPILGWLFNHVDKFLFIGSANKRLYQKYGVPANRLHSAPYAVDNERFARQALAVKGQRAEIRKQWGVPEDSFCVLFCGKFIGKKRPLDLVEATKLFLAQDSSCSKLHLLFVGSGELGPELRKNCNVLFDAEDAILSGRENVALRDAALSWRPTASFAGFLNQTEISKAYVAADCLVLPSDYGETWGLVVNEAMASGLPCLISNRCGSAEDLGNTGSNKSFSCGDLKQLSRLLEEVSSNLQRSAFASGACPPSFSDTISTVFYSYNHDGV